MNCSIEQFEREINDLKEEFDKLLGRLNTRISKSENYVLDNFVDQYHAELKGFTSACILLEVNISTNNFYEESD